MWITTCLSLDDDLVVLFVAHGAVFLVPVVEGDGDRGLRDAGLAVFVNQLLQVGRADLR